MKRAPNTTKGLCYPAVDELPAYVRAYVPSNIGKVKQGKKRRKAAPPSPWTLIFDIETTIDPGQTLRIGSYQLRKSGELKERGLFYDPEILTTNELRVLRRYAADRAYKLLTRSEFVDDVFYGKVYEWRATIVGMNLPFDISRLAIRHSSARGKMKGGFTFQLSENSKRARVQIRHLSARAAFIQFAAEPRRLTARSAAKRGIYTPTRRGSFVDLKTLAAALFSQSFSLEGLSKFLKTSTQKAASEEHGQRLTKRYLDYAVLDVQATWECFDKLTAEFDQHGLTETNIGKIKSEASIGKAYLRQMGLCSLLEMQPDMPHDIIGLILSSYYGGRSEVRWRRTIKQVLYCDFLSMYPTIFTLMKLWSFVIAKGFDWIETTEATRAFLDQVDIESLQKKTTWQKLSTLVQLRPDDDILPLRTRYDGSSCTIGLNHVSSKNAVWYTLADVIGSKLLTGITPRIERALTFVAREPQDTLRPIAVLGVHEIDPTQDDVFKRIIDLRSDVKARMDRCTVSEFARLDAEQQALKTLANSTSYGIFVEINVSDLDKRQERICFGSSGAGFEMCTSKNEEPGPFFNPLIATLITSGARLMLALAETLTLQAGLDWAFCDTDSMALAKPDNMLPDTFFEKSQGVARWFDRLNPYSKPGPLLKIEDANYGISEETKALQKLYAFCISSKRYVLFNIADDSLPIIRKASAHGLGHLRPPYDDGDAPTCIPLPSVPLPEIGVERWQYDLWFQIIRAGMGKHPNEVDLSYHPNLSLPAISRYAATAPAILRWLGPYNTGKCYQEQVKPFGFLAALQVNPLAISSADAMSSASRKLRMTKPIAAFNREPLKVSKAAFDRETGKPVSADALKSYRSVLAQYHLSPEAKFLNGEYLDQGRTERRHVNVTSIIHIGKEANNWEKQFFLGADDNDQIEYGVATSMDARLDALCEQLGEREVSRRFGVSRMSVRKARGLGIKSLGRSLKLRLSRI